MRRRPQVLIQRGSGREAELARGAVQLLLLLLLVIVVVWVLLLLLLASPLVWRPVIP